MKTVEVHLIIWMTLVWYFKDPTQILVEIPQVLYCLKMLIQPLSWRDSTHRIELYFRLPDLEHIIWMNFQNFPDFCMTLILFL